MRIGVDFDNTIACYDGVFRTLAIEAGLLPDGFAGGKQDVRDAVHATAGDDAWRGLQARAYGRRMGEARPFDGVLDQLARWRAGEAEVMIVSHKTRQSNFAPDGSDFRVAARHWMEAQGLFDAVGLKRDDVHFLDSRSAKVRRIADLQCDIFIDDLEEIFEQPEFPATARKILFDPAGRGCGRGDVRPCRHWREMAEAIDASGA